MPRKRHMPDVLAATVDTPTVGVTYHLVVGSPGAVDLGWKLVGIEGTVAVVAKGKGGAPVTDATPRRRVPLTALRHTRMGMPPAKRGPRREDLRRLPLAAQVARVRRYHQDKVKHQGHCGMGDPFITSDNVRKRFRVLCPEGLLRAYAREEAAKAPHNMAGWILLDETAAV